MNHIWAFSSGSVRIQLWNLCNLAALQVFFNTKDTHNIFVMLSNAAIFWGGNEIKIFFLKVPNPIFTLTYILSNLQSGNLHDALASACSRGSIPHYYVGIERTSWNTQLSSRHKDTLPRRSKEPAMIITVRHPPPHEGRPRTYRLLQKAHETQHRQQQ